MKIRTHVLLHRKEANGGRLKGTFKKNELIDEGHMAQGIIDKTIFH